MNEVAGTSSGAAPLDFLEEEEEELAEAETLAWALEASPLEEAEDVAELLDDSVEVEDSLTEVDVAPFLQTKESPWIAPLLCNFFKALQEKLLEEESKLAPPLTDFKEDKSKVEKLPVTSMAPPTVWTLLKPSMTFNCVLLAMMKPPPTVVKLLKAALDNSSLETIDKDWPTLLNWVKFKLGKVLLMKPKEALTVCKLPKEIELTSLKVMLLAQTKLSKAKVVLSPLEENCKESETLSKEDWKEFRYLLLLMLKTLTFFKVEKPSTLSKVVSETIMLLAFCKSVEKVEMAGKVTMLMESTSCKEPKEALVKMINSCMFKSPVIFLIESAEKEDRELELKIVKEPSISWILAKAAEPKSPVMVKLPTMVVQPEILSKSAWAVAVAEVPILHEDGIEVDELTV